MPAIEISTSSPTFMGPTPSGVPVRITSPGSSVITLETWATSVGTSKIRSVVLPSCLRSPLRCVWTAHAVGEGCGSRSVSIQGPSGQKESKPLARVNCTSLRCRSRAVTSLAIV